MHEGGRSLFNLITLMQLSAVSGARYENQFQEVGTRMRPETWVYISKL
jgi:hypothetical protein